MSDIFEIIVFTASLKEVKYIDNNNNFSMRDPLLKK